MLGTYKKWISGNGGGGGRPAKAEVKNDKTKPNKKSKK